MKDEYFWIFGSLGLGDHIVCNALYRHYAALHSDKYIIIPVWEHNLSAVQFMLDDVKNVFFYPIEQESQLLTCRHSISWENKLCLGFYKEENGDFNYRDVNCSGFNPVKWDSEFYRQAGLDPELKWSGFKLPEFQIGDPCSWNKIIRHHDPDRGFTIGNLRFTETELFDLFDINKGLSLIRSCIKLASCEEIHCIDSSMLNLADLMETPYCKRFVFHRYARKGLPPRLKKDWTILD